MPHPLRADRFPERDCEMILQRNHRTLDQVALQWSFLQRMRQSRRNHNLRRLETSESVSSSSFLGLPSAFFAAFPLKFVCKRLCGLHCRPQAKARGEKTDSFHLFKCDLGQTSLLHRREAQRSILYSAFSPQGLSWSLPLAKPAQ